MRTMLASIATAATLFAAAPAVAQPVSDTYSVSIALADLNLDSAAGQAMLQRRILAAANRICTGIGKQPVEQQMRDRACRAEFVRSAGQKVEMAAYPHSGAVFAVR